MSPARTLTVIALLAPLTVGAGTPDAAVGPPWISIELPANPHDPTTRDAYLLVHAWHHGTPMGFPVSGTAEGLVDGKRRSVPLRFERTSRTGVYALRKQWETEGEWSLVLSVAQGEAPAQALVQVSGGEVIGVEVPAERRDGWAIPRRITRAEIEESLRKRGLRTED